MEEGKDEENNNEANGGSWWGSWPSWLQTAKEKSSTALEFMKRDLTEFGQVVQTDAVAAVSSTAAIIKGKLTVDTAEAVADKARQSFTTVLETITDVFAPPKELEESELMIIKDSEPVLMDWWQIKDETQLFRIRTDPRTFCHEPEGPPEMYENWLESFDCTEYQEEMTEIIMSCSDTRALYDKLVPSSVSHLEFWQRYFYRVHLLRKAEAKRAELMRRAEQISIDDIEWDKEQELNDEKNLLPQNQKSEDQLNCKSAKEIVNSDFTSSKLLKDTRPEICSSQSIKTDSSQTILKDEETRQPDISSADLDNRKIDHNSSLLNEESRNVQTEPSSANSTNGSRRSSPIESLGKDSSTGDEWEKDFELEINENDLKNVEDVSQDHPKEDEDDWEKWQ
nr:BSD domain-containing protein 1 isoform X2 [Parasteatoda tepidariorum]